MPGGVVNVPIVGEIAAGAPIDAYEERLDTIAVTADMSPDGTRLRPARARRQHDRGPHLRRRHRDRGTGRDSSRR